MKTREIKFFDPADGLAPFANTGELTDASVIKRGNRWWMYLAGDVDGHEGIQLFSASLPEGAPLAPTGWQLTADAENPTRIAALAGHERSRAWDFKGGRHCPSYVKGWDPHRQKWIERIYYAGSPQNPWGPYSIGYLEWDGQKWVDQSQPVFSAREEWERGSVYEPNLIYHDGKWKLWYVAGSNLDDYLVQGHAESEDGRENWTHHKIFVPAEEKVFDFCVIKNGERYEAVFSRVWLGKGAQPANTGLWWCQCDFPSSNFSDWSDPIRIMDAADRGWHSGPWKPSVQYTEDGSRMLVFFDGSYTKKVQSPFPFAFTLGCLEVERAK